MGDTNDWLANSLVYLSAISFFAIFIAVAAVAIDGQGAWYLPFIESCANGDNTIQTGPNTAQYTIEVNECFNKLNTGSMRNCYCAGDGTCARIELSRLSRDEGIGCDYVSDGDFAFDVRTSSIVAGACFIISVVMFGVSCCTVQAYDDEKVAAQRVRIDTSWDAYKRSFADAIKQENGGDEEEVEENVGQEASSKVVTDTLLSKRSFKVLFKRCYSTHNPYRKGMGINYDGLSSHF